MIDDTRFRDLPSLLPCPSEPETPAITTTTTTTTTNRETPTTVSPTYQTTKDVLTTTQSIETTFTTLTDITDSETDFTTPNEQSPTTEDLTTNVQTPTTQITTFEKNVTIVTEIPRTTANIIQESCSCKSNAHAMSVCNHIPKITAIQSSTCGTVQNRPRISDSDQQNRPCQCKLTPPKFPSCSFPQPE